MPILPIEIFDILAKVYEGFWECFHSVKYGTSVQNLRYTNRHFIKENRRPGGQEKSSQRHKRRGHCFRRYYSETSTTASSSFHSLSEFQAITDYTSPHNRRTMARASVKVGNNRSIGLLPLPNSYIQRPIRSASGYLPRRSHSRLLFLRQQSLRENLRMAFQKHCLNLRQRFLPSVSVHSIRNLNIQQRLLHSVYNFFQQFWMVSNSAELAMLNNGSSPKYISLSPAMNVIDLDQLRQRLNNAIIDYLLIDDDLIEEPAFIIG